MGILVTGGTGFIGAEIVRMLLQKGEKDIFVFDINPSTKLLDDVADQVEVVKGDLGNFSHVLNVVRSAKPSSIYHLGGMLSVPSDADPAASFRANAMGTFHILEAAKLFEVPQVLFSSTIGTYGMDIQSDVMNDYTLQRPQLFYGCTKVFGENMGLFYRRKYGLDYRGLRYPSIVGPGVKTPGVVQYTSWVIEESAKGNPFTLTVKPETLCPILYYKDSALAMVQLAEAPLEKVPMGNYLVTGVPPVATAQELVDIVKKKIPDAQISFDPDLELQAIIDKLLLPVDDSLAREQWGWKPEYDQERIVDDFIEEMKIHSKRYE